MKAVISADAPGAEDVSVAELPDPLARPGEVLIRVSYCGVNYPDVLLLQDRYQLRPPRPFTPRRRSRRRGGRGRRGRHRLRAGRSGDGADEPWRHGRARDGAAEPGAQDSGQHAAGRGRRHPDDLPDGLPRPGPAGIDAGRRAAPGTRRRWRGRTGRCAARQGHGRHSHRRRVERREGGRRARQRRRRGLPVPRAGRWTTPGAARCPRCSSRCARAALPTSSSMASAETTPRQRCGRSRPTAGYS